MGFHINLLNATLEFRNLKKGQPVGKADLMAAQTLIPVKSNANICPLRCVYIPKDPKRGSVKNLSAEEMNDWAMKFNIGTEDEEWKEKYLNLLMQYTDVFSKSKMMLVT